MAPSKIDSVLFPTLRLKHITATIDVRTTQHADRCTCKVEG